MKLHFEKLDEGVMIISVMESRLEPLDVVDILGIDGVTGYLIQGIRSYQPVDVRRFGQELHEKYAIIGTKLIVYYDELSDLVSVPLIAAQSVRIIASCSDDLVTNIVRRASLQCIENNAEEAQIIATMRLLIEKVGVPPQVALTDVDVRYRYTSLRFSLAPLVQSGMS